MTSAADLSALELRARFAARELSPVEALDAVAARIAERQPELNAFITLTLDSAREQARAAERAYASGSPGQLAGIPLAVKDLFDTAGIRTTYGSRIFDDHVPDADAEAVRRVRAAGAVIVGKTLTHEFAWGITSVNPHFGPARNPHDPRRVPGGSSGGNGVALATGMCALALGSDTGGSIRIPAAFCGISGLKPTYGRISARGVFPLAPSLDHVGPMARTPADVRLLYEVLTADLRPAEPARRIAVCPDLHLRPLDAGIRRAFDAAVARLGAIEIAFPEAERIFPAFRTLQAAEAAHAHRELFPARADEYGADVRGRLEAAAAITLPEYLEASRVRGEIASAFARAFEHADLIVTPIAATAPALIDDEPPDFRERVLTYTVPQDVAGLPTCAVPVGTDDLGLPVAVQLTGPPGAEPRVLAAAEALYASL